MPKAVTKKTAKVTQKNIDRKERNRIAANARAKAATAACNEIEKIPKCKHPANVKRAKGDFLFFCKNYFPDVFTKPFLKPHKIVAKEITRLVLRGGRQALAAPRGMFKSTFLKAAIMWALLCHADRHKFVIFIGATVDATIEIKNWIWSNLNYSDNLLADFPQVCVPVKAYEEKQQRRITYKGIPCNCRWQGTKIVFPFVKGFSQSGVAVEFFSYTSRGIRGRSHTIGGTAYRPSIVLADDLQSDDAAASETQVNKILSLVTKVLPQMAGQDPVTGQELETAVLFAGTAIAPRDLTCRLLDHKENPAWRGICLRRMIKMPLRMDLWQEYRDVWAKSILEKGNYKAATTFYRKHKKEMDRGAECLTPKDFSSHEISGIQHAMNFWSDNEISFYTEQQNHPDAAAFAGCYNIVTPEHVTNKVEHIHRDHVPQNTQFLVAFVDPGKNYHAWEVAAFGEHAAFSHTVNYGIFPDQGIPKITKTSYRVGIQQAYKEESNEEERVKESLQDVLDLITQAKYYEHQSGNIIDINESIELTHSFTGNQFHKFAMIAIDAGWIEKTIWEAITKYCAENPQWLGRIVPSYGTSANSRLVRNWDLEMKLREWQRGRNLAKNGTSTVDWIENPRRCFELYTKYQLPISIIYDSNIYKSKSVDFWLTPKGEAGCHTIFDSPDQHIMYADHQSNERQYPCKIGPMDYSKWREVVGSGGNCEFLDTRAGCMMLGSYVGLY